MLFLLKILRISLITVFEILRMFTLSLRLAFYHLDVIVCSLELKLIKAIDKRGGAIEQKRSK